MLTEALEEKYGVEIDALPFLSFDYVMQNQAIFFCVQRARPPISFRGCNFTCTL